MQWLPGALQEQGVMPGILTCCHALAHTGDRCVAPCTCGQAMLPLRTVRGFRVSLSCAPEALIRSSSL